MCLILILNSAIQNGHVTPANICIDEYVSRYAMLISILVLCRRRFRLLGFLRLHFMGPQICWICAKSVFLKSMEGRGVRFAQVLFERESGGEGVNQTYLYYTFIINLQANSPFSIFSNVTVYIYTAWNI